MFILGQTTPGGSPQAAMETLQPSVPETCTQNQWVQIAVELAIQWGAAIVAVALDTVRDGCREETSMC